MEANKKLERKLEEIEFESDLEDLLNRHGKGSLLDIPDPQLAKYLSSMLQLLEDILIKHDEYLDNPVLLEKKTE